MNLQLLVNVRVYRNRFVMEDYIGSDDIFALVESGRFVFESADGRHTVGANEGALFRRNVLYHRQILSPAVLCLFRFRSDTPPFHSDHVKFADTARITSTLAMLKQLDRGTLREDFAFRTHLFADIVNQYTMENGGLVNRAQKEDGPIEEALASIRMNLHKKPMLSEIGEKTGLSYVQFLRRFQAYTGMSPSDYITSLRLQKAKSLLTDTPLLIKDIAPLCGFENEYYFSNFFKKHLGMSPSAFRALTL